MGDLLQALSCCVGKLKFYYLGSIVCFLGVDSYK